MIQVINRALEIMEFVADNNNKPVQLNSIAEYMQLNNTTCANIVKTLVEKNYLENVSRKEGYILGINVFKLTRDLTYHNDLVASSRELIDGLSRQLNENCLLGIIKNNKRVIIYLAQADNDLQARAKIEIEDIYSTGTGRVLLSYLPEGDQDKYIKRWGLPQPDVWPGVQTLVELKKAMFRIREDKILQTLSAYGIIGVSVPIFQKNVVVASLCVFLPESRFTPKHKENIYTLIHATALKMQAQIDHN